MNKLLIIHYYPIDYFPPVMNLIDALQDRVLISVISTQKSNSLSGYRAKSSKIYYPVKENKLDSSFVVLFKYIFFTIYSLLKLIKEKPDIILYYESISALAPYIYKKFFNPKAKICIHYHEYMTQKEYDRPGMRLAKFNHKIECDFLYYNAIWISQTNQYRLKFFMDDYPFVDKSICHLLPNYPPKSWHVQSKTYFQNNVINCVYIGSLSLIDTYLKDFCEWVIQQDGRIHFSIYSFNYHSDVKEYIDKISSPYITFYKKGISYSEIPSILNGYDVGLLLYKASTLNVKYCETNKFYEYLVSGLNVWYPCEMILLHEMDKSIFAPIISEFDFREEKYPDIDHMNKTVDNSQYNRFSEDLYCKFYNWISLIC